MHSKAENKCKPLGISWLTPNLKEKINIKSVSSLMRYILSVPILVGTANLWHDKFEER